ncbi:NAD-dependent protein deacetylase SRT1 [Exaiptasia diaphana]|nr:NAD-dependent protein deacetylase SRT1 [Exaiptasia diaphana]
MSLQLASLRVTPAADIPENVIRNRQRVVICNLQKTPLNDHCALEIHAQIDEVMVGVMKRLGLDIPAFTINRRLAVDVSDGKISFQGLDVARETPYSFLRTVKVTFRQGSGDSVLLTREPFVTPLPPGVTQPFKADIILGLQGHYNEPDIKITEEFNGKTLYMLSYRPRDGGDWKVTRN